MPPKKLLLINLSGGFISAILGNPYAWHFPWMIGLLVTGYKM
jgi:hypothetical protein